MGKVCDNGARYNTLSCRLINDIASCKFITSIFIVG
jgi:hypothetical protein